MQVQDQPQPGLEVTDIRWERVNLTLLLKLNPELTTVTTRDTHVTIFDQEREFPVSTTIIDDWTFELKFNITRFEERKAVPNGSWRIRLSKDGEEVLVARYNIYDTETLEDVSRSFIYSGNRTIYAVTFGLSEDEDSPEFIMRTYQFFRGGGRNRSPLAWLRRKVKNAKISTLRRYYHWHKLWRPKRRPEIIFASSQRASLSGNLLSVYERMIARGLEKDFKLTQSFRVPADSTKFKTLRAVKLLARAEIVLLDDYFPMLDTLPISQYSKVIQLWHAGSGFKNVGYSRFGKYGSPTLDNAHRKYHYAICGSSALVPVYAEAFGIEEEVVIPTGLPRLDGYLDEDRVASFKGEFFKRYPDLRDKKLILFAPTFRGRGIHDAYYNYSWLDLPTLYEHLGENSVFLFKMHPFIQEAPPIPPGLSSRIKDITDFPNINDLLLVCDILITDYSSVIYEYATLNRPMVFFAPDKDVYAAVRGFHWAYEEVAPGPICVSFDDLLVTLEQEEYDDARREVFIANNFDHFDNHASDRVIDQLVLTSPSKQANS